MAYQSTSCCTELPRHRSGATILQALKIYLAEAMSRYRAHREAKVARAAFRSMLSLDDEILDDIGVTRSDVQWASQLPIHQSAAQALEKTKKRARPKIRY